MAPTKKEGGEKEAKLTPDQSAALILDYLRKQNRPYSATDISSNLKNRVTKTAAAKLLKDMHERQEIEGRAAGKQIVYHVIQDEAPDEAEQASLQALDDEAKKFRDNTVALRVEEKELRLMLRDGSSQVPLNDLKASAAALELKVAELSERLMKLKGGTMKPVSHEEREQVSAGHRKWAKAASARQKIRKNMWADIAANLPTAQIEETKESLGLEF